MNKFKLSWLNIGTPLFILTYINIAIFITYIFQPKILVGIKDMLNAITNNYISKIFSNINSDMIYNLYLFYFYLIGVCACLLYLSILLCVFKIIIPSRIGEILGWLISLLTQQFNIFLIAKMTNDKMATDTCVICISGFLFFTYLHLNSHDYSNKYHDA
ncbi:hypothetical protein ML436_09785 [Staphylococcus roterodami]|nr:hypothetical protein ML436_09785 [Staphylococcus roterodami]